MLGDNFADIDWTDETDLEKLLPPVEPETWTVIRGRNER